MSHATVNPDRAELIQCPYDPVHMISQMRFPYHLIKCRKNHDGKEYQQCPYDAKHVILKKRFEDHLKTCDKKAIIEPQLVLDDNRGENLFVPESNAYEIEQTLTNEWDLEAPTAGQLAAHTSPITQTTHNTFLEYSYRNEVIRSSHVSSGTTMCEPMSYGRGRARNTNSNITQSFTVAGPGPSSYTLDNSYNHVDNYNPPPVQSFGRGRGLLSFTSEQSLRRPAKPAKNARESLEGDRQRLHKKIREIAALQELVQNGGVLEQNQISKIITLEGVQRELGEICKQLEKL